MVGRWTQKDGAGFGGGTNFYVYAWNDPVDFVDPLGLFPVPDWVMDAADALTDFASTAFATGLLGQLALDAGANPTSAAGQLGTGTVLAAAAYATANPAPLVAALEGALPAAAVGGAAAAAGGTCGGGGAGISAVAERFGAGNAGIFGRAAAIIGESGSGSFWDHLGALAQATGEAVPMGQVWEIGELDGQPIFGAVRNVLGIVSTEAGTMIVHAPQGGPVTILGPLLK